MTPLKQILLIYAVVVLVGCEGVYRPSINKTTGEVILPHSGLEKVTSLLLGDNELTEIPKGLEKLTQLKVLYLDNNKLTDVKGLEKLDQLEKLHLSENHLTDVTGLEKLTQLKELGLWCNPDLTKAQVAELQKALPNCKIFTAATFVEKAIREQLKKPTGELTKADLEKVTRLRFPRLWFPDVVLNVVLKEVAKLKNLRELSMGHVLTPSRVTDAGLKEVAKLKNLTLLYLHSTRVTKAGVAQLQKALPKCEIICNPKK